VLDDPAVVVDAEDVDPGVVVAGPGLVAVQDDQVAFTRTKRTCLLGWSTAIRSK
jgi:hypothetical protein